MYPYNMAIHYMSTIHHWRVTPRTQSPSSYLVIVYVFHLLILEIYRMPYVVRLINARDFFINV